MAAQELVAAVGSTGWAVVALCAWASICGLQYSASLRLVSDRGRIAASVIEQYETRTTWS
jgi:hypothetical protein